MAAKLKRYSVLLQYPEWIACDGSETFYHWVMARNPEEAAVRAIKAAVRRNDVYFFEDGEYCDAAGSPLDFGVVLVIPGWIHGTGVDYGKVRDGINEWVAVLKGGWKCEKQKKRSSRARGSSGSTHSCPAKRARKR